MLTEISGLLVLELIIPITSFIFGLSDLTIALAVISIVGGELTSVGAHQVQRVLESKQAGK
ncbi:hypothetical protein SUSAZ_08960 [Sulfolobus acidocaldarius SUSAZ]|nr:hypothetical protein SUSAZ_08960 [Sulfolobus acidocaldarius SUSAZ]